MGMFGHSHAWRAVVLAWGLAWLGPAAVVSAAALDPSERAGLAEKSAERFGLFASPLSVGGLR